MRRVHQTVLLLAVGSGASCTRSPDGSTDSATSTSSSGPSTGQCESEFHGPYWCECEGGETKACDGDGVSLCVTRDDEVITDDRWSPCGECLPGEQRACDIASAPGREFCNVLEFPADEIDDLPTPQWGICVLEDMLVCEPQQAKECSDELSVTCDVDEMGVPYWPSC